jgi:hypothetical protein
MISIISAVATPRFAGQRPTRNDVPQHLGLGVGRASDAVPSHSGHCFGWSEHHFHAAQWALQKNPRNEGITHDLIDNKGSILGTHDVDENKADIHDNPRYY